MKVICAIYIIPVSRVLKIRPTIPTPYCLFITFFPFESALWPTFPIQPTRRLIELLRNTFIPTCSPKSNPWNSFAEGLSLVYCHTPYYMLHGNNLKLQRTVLLQVLLNLSSFVAFPSPFPCNQITLSRRHKATGSNHVFILPIFFFKLYCPSYVSYVMSGHRCCAWRHYGHLLSPFLFSCAFLPETSF